MDQEQGTGLPAICAELRVRYDGHVPVVNSRHVGDEFDKRHDNVLRDIELLRQAGHLLKSEEILYFRECIALDAYGREQRSIDMTRNGFLLLVFGWTGPKAFQIKLRYIQAFDAMEEALRANHAGIMQMDRALASMIEAQAKAAQSLQVVEYKVDTFAAHYKAPRQDITSSTKAEHVRALSLMGGYCPCCGRARVLNDDGQRAPFAEFDHFYQNSHRDAAHTWLICKPCHNDFTTGRVARSDRTAEFAAYQNKRQRLPGAQPSLF